MALEQTAVLVLEIPPSWAALAKRLQGPLDNAAVSYADARRVRGYCGDIENFDPGRSQIKRQRQTATGIFLQRWETRHRSSEPAQFTHDPERAEGSRREDLINASKGFGRSVLPADNSALTVPFGFEFRAFGTPGPGTSVQVTATRPGEFYSTEPASRVADTRRPRTAIRTGLNVRTRSACERAPHRLWQLRLGR